MIEPTASRFWQAALQSGLVDAQTLQACWDAIPEDKRAPEHVDRRLARQAVQSGVLTLWQAQQLIAGRSGGFKIDRYVLVGLIGQGGMGRVYLARDSRLNRQVAVKILSPERVNNPRAIARFHREALVGAQLQHENLVRVYDEGESTGRCYLVMEYIEGKNIGQMIAEGGPIPPAVTARLGLQVALGLEHAQRKGLIHRDVNPYNILVTRDGTAKLTDLGLAIDLADQDRVTRDGATVGTFDYVSPEQARHSHSVDTRSDIYSLGCTLYHMLTGQVPFPSASLPEKLFSHQANEPEPITNLAPDVPEGLAEIVARMMRKSADDRYATPLELAQALEPFADVPHGPDPGAASRSGVRLDASVTHVSTPTADAASSASQPAAPVPAEAVPESAPPAPFVAEVPPPEVVEATLGTPASHDDALVGLGINLNAGPESALARGGPAEKPKPRTAPPRAVEPTPTPTPAAPGSNDDASFLGLGINLNAGAEPPAPRGGPAEKPRPKPKAAPTPPAEHFSPPPVPAEATPEDASFLGLGINLNADAAPRGAAAEKPKIKPKVAPAPAPPAPADESPFGLGINLNLGPEPPLARSPAPEKPKPKPRATTPTPPPAAAPPLPPVVFEPPPEASAPEESPFGLGINLNLGPEQPLTRGPAPEKPKPKPQPKPKAAPPVVPTPPAVFEPPPEASAPEESPFGLGINLNLGPEQPLTRGPAAEKPKPKPKAAPTTPPPAVAPPAPPVVFEPPPEASAPEESPFGLGINLNLGPEPPLTRGPAPEKPKPKPKAAPTPPPPATVPPPPVSFEPAPEPAAADDALAGLGIGVNLGPEPSLSRGATAEKPKPKPKPQPKANPKPKAPAPAKSKTTTAAARPPWVMPAAAGAGLLVLLIVGAVVYRSFSGGTAAATSTAGGTSKAGKTVARAPGAGRKPKARPQGAGPQVTGDLAVVAADETVENDLPDLATAMRAAIGGRGYVVLSNSAPLKIAPAKPIVMSGGRLVIKAGEGATPVLEVVVKGRTPFLATRTETPLRIEGVTIVVRYVDPGNDPAPVIDAGGSVELDRCSIRVEGAVPAGARAVSMEGGTLTATGCWFENFDRALDLACFDGTVMTLRHCMFVRSRPGDPNASPLGWALRARGMPGGLGKTGRRLVFNHCTTRGQGFVDFSGFSAETPVKVEPTACAVLAESLISWTPAPPPTREALTWTGVDNQYDVRGQTWVLLGPGMPMPDGPGNLDSWTKAIAAETGPIPPPLKFATDLASLSEHPEPRDFAVTSQGAQIPGADPSYVGPGGKSLAPAARRR